MIFYGEGPIPFQHTLLPWHLRRLAPSYWNPKYATAGQGRTKQYKLNKLSRQN